MRQQLQRIAVEFRDFAHVQKKLTEILNTSFPTIPQEVFEAISHDPATMTGQTRRLKGWRAVEEVHCRINRQQEILSGFAATLTEFNNRLPRPKGIFDEPLDGLMKSLSRLEHHQGDLRKKESEATQKLAHVRELHVLTKLEFNDTLGYTSHIYPEVVTVSLNSDVGYTHEVLLVIINIGSSREVQEQVPEVLGHLYGRVNLPVGLDHTFLEELWQDDWDRHSRLSDHSMVSQRVHRTAKAISYHRLTETIFPTLAWPSVIRYRVSRLSIPSHQMRCVCHCARFHVLIWPKPWSEHRPLALFDCDLSCHVGGCHLRILRHCRADRCCFLVAGLVRRHFFVILSIHPLPCPSIPHFFSSALSRCQLAFVKPIASIRNVQHIGIRTHNVLMRTILPYLILQWNRFRRIPSGSSERWGNLEILRPISAFRGSGQTRTWRVSISVVIPFDLRTVGCASALQRLHCSLKVGLISSGTAGGAKTII